MNFNQILDLKLKEQTNTIIHKKLKDLPPPESLKNNFKAAKRILEHLNNGKRMLIVGDYDCDGIMATTILYSFLIEAGYSKFNVDYIIPSRLKDGYGVSTNIIDYAMENVFDFIVTVDNGIAAIDAVKYSNENNIEVIITDHHTVPKTLPEAYTIVNPRVDGETFPFPWISGATVAWYLTAALKKELKSNIDIKKYLDYVALTVVSDVMPLNDINLAILNYGLKEIKKRKRLFYQLVWNDWTSPTINETSLSFDLVPKINAIGRISDANIGVEMFTSNDTENIKRLFDKMTKINEERKEMSRSYIKEAEEILHDIKGYEDENVVIVRNKDFHEGIVGIIAGKLAEKYGKPAYVFSYNEEKDLWKGSARSVGNIHLYDITAEATSFIAGFGGHKGAVGLAVTEKNWEDFVKSLQKTTKGIEDSEFIDQDKIPLECNISDINMETISILEKYGPYGNGNQKPIFKSKANIFIAKELKNGLHFKVKLEDNGFNIFGLFFNVDKKTFLSQIEDENNEFTFDTSKSYDLRQNSFSVELLCNMIIN